MSVYPGGPLPSPPLQGEGTGDFGHVAAGGFITPHPAPSPRRGGEEGPGGGGGGTKWEHGFTWSLLTVFPPHRPSLLPRKDYRGSARATSGRPCSPCSLPVKGRGPEDPSYGLLIQSVVA